MAATVQAPFAHVPLKKVENYWNARPCNIRHTTVQVGTKEFYDQVEQRKYMVEPHIPVFANFPLWNGKHVLEIGCGIGTDTMNFARAGATVTAVDLSTESLKLAKQRAELYGLSDKITFYHANAENLSEVVPVEAYDLIYSFGVIHHTPHPENAVREILKFTKPSTRLKLMVYNRYSWKVLWILMKYGKLQFNKVDKWIARHSEAQTGCPVTYSYTCNTVKHLLEGFRTTRIRADHIFPYKIPEYKRYQYVKVWYFRWMPKKLFRRLEQAFGWHLLVDAVPEENR